jgi:hypothetical protein
MALTTNTSYLQPTGFSVSISRENYPNLEFFAQGIQHPGMNMNETEVAYKRVNIKQPGDKLTFTPLSVTAILDEDLTAYLEVVNWMERLVEQNNTTPSRRADGPVDTVSDIRVSILTSHNNVNKTIVYHNAFPTNLSTIQLESAATDVTYITYTVDFSYDYWEFV